MADYDQYCNIPEDSPWFPTAPGITAPNLPTVGTITENQNPAPPNAVEAGLGFDENNPDLCILFDDTLSVPTEPLFPEELNTSTIIPPYLESVAINVKISIKCSIDFWGYSPEVVGKDLSVAISVFGELQEE
jgi:hypothetical protein